jgi:mycothiol synthase
MTERPVTAVDLDSAQVAGVLELAGLAAGTDGVAPLSEHVLLHLRYDRDESGAGRDFVVTTDGEIAGYAYLDPPEPEVSGELVVHPAWRRRGIGQGLIRDLAAAVDGHTLQLWAHGDLPAAGRLAGRTGFERFRALWQMRRSLRDRLDRPEFPPGSTLRTFRPGQDEEEWLSLNSRAFAKHPEQGAWTRHDLELREREPWFDPGGFLIAVRDGRMAGFHWTKVHPEQAGPEQAGPEQAGPEQAGPEQAGEVYVVGVDPGEQGSGLGRALTLAGLGYLRDRGLDQAMLYVDEDNVPAIRLYEALGFTRARTDAMYRRPPSR